MKLDIILKNALNHPNKVAYFKRVFDRPEWKYTDFTRDYLEPLFQRIEKHKEGVYNEYERQETQLNVAYEMAKRNKLDFYDAYLKKAIDLNLGISMDEYTKQENKKIVNTYPKMLKNLKPEKIRIGGIIRFNLTELNTIEKVLKEINSQESEKPKDEVYKTQNLFKVGLLFATGKVNKYFTVNGKNEIVVNKDYTVPTIAEELGDKRYNKWILATINNYSSDIPNGNKNVFNNAEMMKKIISHCKAESLPIDNYFKSRL